jgi:hypothetical protein
MSTLPSILIGAALASLSAGALAASDGVDGVREQAKATYNADRKACAALPGEERKNCLNRARAQYNQARAEARRMEAEQKREKAKARAEARDVKKRKKVSSGGGPNPATAGSNRPAAGAESAGERAVAPDPGAGMGKAPEGAGPPPSR